MSVSEGSAAGKEDQPSKTFSAMYVETWRMRSRLPRERRRSKVPIRSHDWAKRVTMAPGSRRSRRTFSWGKSVRAKALVEGIFRALSAGTLSAMDMRRRVC